jgi:hypothetical protein
MARFEITQASSDGFPFAKDSYTVHLPAVASFADADSFGFALSTAQADWLMHADDTAVRKRAANLCELLLPRERLAECGERVQRLGWRYHLGTGWVEDGYQSGGKDTRFVRVHLVRSTTEKEDEAADYIESGKAERDRVWRRAGM